MMAFSSVPAHIIDRGQSLLVRCVRSITAHMYSGTSDKGPSEIGTTSLQKTLVSTPC